MSNQIRAAELLRQAASALMDANVTMPAEPTASSSSTSNATNSNHQVPSTHGSGSGSVQNAVRNIFAPYRRFCATGGAKRRASQITPAPSISYWSHRFCLLPNRNQETAPTKEEKHEFFLAGFGEKKLSFPKNDDPSSFKQILEDKFPSLKDCGGYELLRTAVGSRVALEELKMPTNGFTTNYLANESNLGQAVCYLRPIQKDLHVIPVNDQSMGETVFQECLTCKDSVPLSKLRDHVRACTQLISSDEENGNSNRDIPVMKRRKQAPVCQYTCRTDREEQQQESCEQNSVSMESLDQKSGTCPVCTKEFPESILPIHASSCGVLNDPNINLQECLAKIADGIKDLNPWSIKVIRRSFELTASEQLRDADDDEWGRPVKVQFIGEEGVDAGGLTREFFTLLFKTTKVIEKNTFSVDPHLFDEKHYFIFGKAVAKALVCGHPGPRCLNKHVANYILLKKEPDFTLVSNEEIHREDVSRAIKEIEEATTDNIQSVYNEHMSVLEATGYSRVLTLEKKQEAIKALKGFYLLYRPMAAINQFMEGLALHGILAKLQEHPNEAITFLSETPYPSADEVQAFYKPTFSEVEEEKAREELIMYNWGKCLRNIEKGRISTPWLSIETETPSEEIVKLNIGHVLQALIGCPRIPLNIENGCINFDHQSENYPKVNTCVPSITFSRIKELGTYEAFENILEAVIVQAYGFGSV